MQLPRLLCTLENAGILISGIRFGRVIADPSVSSAMLSESLDRREADQETVRVLLTIPGYRIATDADVTAERLAAIDAEIEAQRAGAGVGDGAAAVTIEELQRANLAMADEVADLRRQLQTGVTGSATAQRIAALEQERDAAKTDAETSADSLANATARITELEAEVAALRAAGAPPAADASGAAGAKKPGAK